MKSKLKIGIQFGWFSVKLFILITTIVWGCIGLIGISDISGFIQGSVFLLPTFFLFSMLSTFPSGIAFGIIAFSNPSNIKRVVASLISGLMGYFLFYLILYWVMPSRDPKTLIDSLNFVFGKGYMVVITIGAYLMITFDLARFPKTGKTITPLFRKFLEQQNYFDNHH